MSIWIRDVNPGSYFRELFDVDPDPRSGIFLTLDPGFGIRDGKIWIRDLG
jgi:hypothetical protein